MASPPPWSEELLGLVIAGLYALCRSWRSAPSPPWSELPQELLGRVLAGLPHPADCARFHSVCRSWYSAPSPPQLSWINPVCRSWYSVSSPQQQSSTHAVCRMLYTASSPSEIPWRRIGRSIFSPRRQPWIVLPDGFFLDDIALDFSDCGPQPTTSFPENLRCVGSTDSWLALDYMDDGKSHTYFLHNPFCKTTVPLPKLDAVIGNVSEFFRIRKVLMRSTPDDLISVMTNNRSYPIILIQPKKGVWLPKPQTPLLASIIDVAFIGDRLYGITTDEDLVSLHITVDIHGVPVVTSIEHVIWSNIDDADAPGDDENNGEDNEGEQDNDEVLSEEYTELTWNIGDFMIDGEGIQCEGKFMILRYLVESRGKLLMVRRKLSGARLSYKVEVFEANMSAGAWIPMSGGLGGQALFMSIRFSKSVSAHGDVEPDAIYIIDLGQVFSMKPQPINPQGRFIGYFRDLKFLGFDLPTWVFPPN